MSQDILNNFLIAMADVLKEAKDFSMQQIPLVAKEILLYNLVFHIIWMIFPSLVMWYLVKRSAELHKYCENNPHGMPSYNICVILLWIIPLIVFLSNLIYAAKVYFAPRLFLLEYIAALLHNGK